MLPLMAIPKHSTRRPATASAVPSASPAGAPVDLDAVRSLLLGLDREQRRAVTHADGPLVVLAGPGTGKTEVVTRRIAWLIASRRARPSEILALTFTDRAASEMQARVDMLVPYGRSEASIHTFHAFGDRLVREHAHELGLPSEPHVLSRAQSIVLLREHVMSLGLKRYLVLADPARPLPALVDAIASFSVMTHFESIQKGVLDSRDILYFLSVMVFSLFTTGVIVRTHRAG